MKLPPPPPSGRRFFQFLTCQGQQAVEQGSGPLYDLLVETIFTMNSDCFESKEEVQVLLGKMVWPPENVEDLFNDFPHIPKIATHLRLTDDGDWIPVFEADLKRWMEISAARACFKKAFIEQYGGVERFRQQRASCIAEGLTAKQFDRQVQALARDAERRVIRPWWKFW